ncbi:ABC transporter permease [Paenibacillus physcomitrellae]|uniref:ABC3 transporter permease C-terminal domain-containing protein n=1 Tax=Paenibacillus physcomitrellae TaxID=1619311 RepID=A0ABQ1FVQ4_9BACL|nr:ABC transporter permease [Paenibacillus physcomitrellae]GGA32076.1 hypothetical protein GCM10010917_16540 [Paenibacillus physcomitrellae]
MTFRHVILQNLKFNTRRFLSYLFVNSFVVAVLFLYGSLLFNEILARDPAMKLAKSYVNGAAYAIVLFSIVFVAYTGIYFVKSRGREFGVYLTLGMTTRDLSRMIRIENLVIVAGSILCGLLSGVLLSKLFYLMLSRVLDISGDIYYISYKTFLLSLGVFLVVFLCNLVFTSRFLHKLSILQITKASSTKGHAKSHPVLGCMTILVLAFSLWFYHAAVAYNGWAKGIVEDYPMAGYLILVFGIFGSLYFVVAFFIDAVRTLLKRFPPVYNRYILILSNLSHRFVAYKVSLYLVTLLIALAVVFMGFGLSTFSFGKKTIGEYEPYDYMVQTSGDINRISGPELQRVVTENGGTLDLFHALEFIPDVHYRNSPDGFAPRLGESMLISESQFNAHMGLSLNVAPDELIIVSNHKEMADEPVHYDSVITVDPWREGVNRALTSLRNPVSMDEFLKGLGDAQRLVYKSAQTKTMYASFINSYGDLEFPAVTAHVVDDSVYNKLQAQRETTYLFNLKSGDGERIFSALLNTLREKNNADASLWASPETTFVDRGEGVYVEHDKAQSLRPIYKGERYEIAFRVNGFLLFALSFLGFLFLLSSSIVLYYKVATDIDEEKEHAALLSKIGLTEAEYKAYLRTHLAIIFFAPMVIGGGLGLFLIDAALNFTVYAGYLKGRVLLMYGIFVLFDILFYLSLKKKFIRGVGLFLRSR